MEKAFPYFGKPCFWCLVAAGFSSWIQGPFSILVIVYSIKEIHYPNRTIFININLVAGRGKVFKLKGYDICGQGALFRKKNSLLNSRAILKAGFN